MYTAISDQSTIILTVPSMLTLGIPNALWMLILDLFIRKARWWLCRAETCCLECNFKNKKWGCCVWLRFVPCMYVSKAIFLFLQITSRCVFRLKESIMIFGSVKHNNILFYYDNMFQSTDLQSSLQNSEKSARQCKWCFCNMGSHENYRICLKLFKIDK
jgi:hypothetical protein